MKIFSYLLWIIIIVLGVSFAVLNAEFVKFNYFTNEITLPLSLLLVFAFAVGSIGGLIVSLGMVFRYKTEIAHLKRQLKKLDTSHLQPVSHD